MSTTSHIHPSSILLLAPKSSCRAPSSRKPYRKKNTSIRHAFRRRRDRNHFLRQTLPARLRNAQRRAFPPLIATTNNNGERFVACVSVCTYMWMEGKKIVKILTCRTTQQSRESPSKTRDLAAGMPKLSLYGSMAKRLSIRLFCAIIAAGEIGGGWDPQQHLTKTPKQTRVVAGDQPCGVDSPCEPSVFRTAQWFHLFYEAVKNLLIQYCP